MAFESGQRGHGERMEIQMATATALKPSVPKQLPPPNSDFYHFAETLSADELATLKQVRASMETKIAPVINKHWGEDAFPFELLPAFKELNLELSQPCPWTTPALVEICIGLEINGYLPADL
jgi:glutaryl-CoA dehydrogenase